MGCGSSADTGTQYASLGHHGQQGTKPNNTTQRIQATPTNQQSQQQTQQQQQQQQQHGTQENSPPPPYVEKNSPKPARIERPAQKTLPTGPVAVQSKDVKSSFDYNNTENMKPLGLPDFESKHYQMIDLGIHELSIDERLNGEPFPTQEPQDLSYLPYTDEYFPPHVAHPEQPDLIWKRPGEIAEQSEVVNSPVLFSDGTTRFDIGQGELGTCWFLAMVSNIADKPRLLRRVIPENAWNPETGIFHCQFYRFGAWIDVYIDDTLPTKDGECILGAQSSTDPNEMWVSFLEKAFAKLYGSYMKIEAGLTADSYLNLTGGIAEYICFKKMKMKPEKLFQRLINAFKCHTTMVGCAVPNENDKQYGLVGGHAYSLTGAYRVGGNQLVRVQNPWGAGEWTGAWSDGSPQWETVGNELVPPPSKDNGEFYMDFQDFLHYFADLTICNLTPDFDREDNEDRLGYVTNIYGNWRDGKMGGSHDRLCNPQFCVTIGNEGQDENGKVPFVVQIIQRTHDRHDDIEEIRCDVYKVLNQNGHCMAIEDIGDHSHLYMDNLQVTYRFLVEPGTYIAIPSTMRGGIEKEFLLRFFSSGPLSDSRELKQTKVLGGKGRNGDEPYDTNTLRYTLCDIGALTNGFNAGGQVACPGFANNPQYLLTVHEDQQFRIEIARPEEANEIPIGFRLFYAPGDMFPVDYDWLMQNYEQAAVRTTEGDEGCFIMGPSTTTCYRVSAGQYILIIHADTEENECDFCVDIFSEKQIDMSSAHVHEY